MKKVWIVVLDRPFYPEVRGEFSSLEEADAELSRILQEDAYPDGEYESTAYVAEVFMRHKIRTYH